MIVRPISDADRPVLRDLVGRLWGSDVVLSHDTVFHPAELPGFLAVDGSDVVGVLTRTEVDRDTVEIVTIDALRRRAGIGTALLTAAIDAATALGAGRLVLTTTNDNLDALRFYQRRGFQLVALRPGAVTRARERKPEIPMTGDYGILLTDELDLALRLSGPHTAVV